jgi:uncharacterized protein DUF5996
MADLWPALPLEEWKDTYATLHRWTQIVGKIRLARSPWINHSWGVTLYVTARGLTTSPMWQDARAFQIDFDFIDHRLVVATADGALRTIPLRARPVAEFYEELFAVLRALDLEIHIHPTPNELPDAIRLDTDREHASYDAGQANRFWRVLVQSDRVFKQFRARFIGKCSPVHFFWGSFDLAVTRFSGRRAPEHPGGVPHLPDEITREAYSHEVSSAGFWPGGGPAPFPAYYSYAYPTPEGFGAAAVRPAAASFNRELGEFLLPYDEVRRAASPDTTLLEFLQSTYEAAAGLAHWDRAALELR